MIFIITEVEVKIIRFEGDEDSGMETTPIIVTEITGIEIPKVKVTLIGAEDGIIAEVRDIVIREEGEYGTLISNIMTQGTNNQHSLQTQIITAHHLWDINIDTQSHMSNTHILSVTFNECFVQYFKLMSQEPMFQLKVGMLD